MFGFTRQTGPPCACRALAPSALRAAPLSHPTRPYRPLFSSFMDTTGIEPAVLNSRFRALKRPSLSPCDFHQYIYIFLSLIAPTYRYDALPADLSPSLLILYYIIIYYLFVLKQCLIRSGPGMLALVELLAGSSKFIPSNS
jgi:hypothetical protein